LEIIQDTADAVAGGRRDLAYLILQDGRRIAVLQRQAGEYRAEAAIAQAQAEARAAKKKSKWGGIGSIVKTAAKMAITYYTGTPVQLKANPKTFLPTPKPASDESVPVSEVLGDLFTSLGTNSASMRLIQSSGNIQADLARKLSDIDAQITEIQALQNAEVQFTSANEVLIQAEAEIKQLILQQANLRLAMRIAERDALREEMVLQQLLSEVESLLADWARQRRMLEDGARPWARPDYRAVYNSYQADADWAFLRAQSWTFMVLRALDYYTNQSQDLTDLYNQLYRARKADHLQTILNEVGARLTLNSAISPHSCPERTVLSLRYHIISQTPTIVNPETGKLLIDRNVKQSVGALEDCDGDGAVDVDDYFRYYDTSRGDFVCGEEARRARMYDFLDSSLDRRGDLVLEFEFSTDLFLRQYSLNGDDNLLGIENPLFTNTALRSQTLSGFTPANCATGSARHGVSINILGRGIPTSSPGFGNMTMELAQVGTMYQRSGSPSITFNPAKQLFGMIAYPTYPQVLPIQFRLTGAETEIQRITVPGSRTAQITPRINGQPASDQRLSLLFTDRAVANDRWRVRIDWNQHITSRAFLLKLRDALDEHADNKSGFDYVEDFEFRLGWVAKFTQ
jgi:hypothetical protein